MSEPKEALKADAEGRRPKRRLSRHDVAFLAVVYAMTFVTAFNENVINVALLDISQAFSISPDTGQWLITGYMIVAAITTACSGFVSRRFSSRAIFFAIAAAMVGGEALCLVSPTFAMLLPCRLVQAVGSGLIPPLMMNAVVAVVPRERMGLFMALGGACITLGPALGPLLSGLVTTAFDWRAIFVLPGAISLALGIAGIFAVRNIHEPEAVHPDALSIVLLAAGITLFVYGVGSVMADIVPALACIALSAACLVPFARRQFRIPVPLLDLRPLLRASFWPAALLVVCGMLVSFSMSVVLPMYFEGAFGTTALIAGLLTLPAIAVNATATVVGGRIMDRFGEWPLLPCGCALILAGQATIALMSVDMAVGLVAVTLLIMVVHAGVGSIISSSETAGLRLLPENETFAGTALMNTLLMISGSVGSSLFVGLYITSMGAAEASGTVEQLAQAMGFSSAAWAGALIGAVALAVSLAYARRMKAARRREQAKPRTGDEPHQA